MQVSLVVMVCVALLSLSPQLQAAQLNPVEASALQDLCIRPGTNRWSNCSDTANACNDPDSWFGIECNAANDSIISMYY